MPSLSESLAQTHFGNVHSASYYGNTSKQRQTLWLKNFGRFALKWKPDRRLLQGR